jgi:hypothetical protein
MALQPSCWALAVFFSVSWYFTQMSDVPVTRPQPLPTHRTQIQSKCTQTSMSLVGFEPTIRVFELAKTVHALDRAATVLSYYRTRWMFFCVFLITDVDFDECGDVLIMPRTFTWAEYHFVFQTAALKLWNFLYLRYLNFFTEDTRQETRKLTS